MSEKNTSLKQLICELFPGTKTFKQEVKEWMHERGGMGATELASQLFTGQGFVLYGHGKTSPAQQMGYGVHGAASELSQGQQNEQASHEPQSQEQPAQQQAQQRGQELGRESQSRGR